MSNKTEGVPASHNPTSTTQRDMDDSIATASEEAAVIRKLDWNLLPLVWVLYSLSILDRTNLGNAKLAGLSRDIDLSGNRYNLLSSIFYIACKWFTNAG